MKKYKNIDAIIDKLKHLYPDNTAKECAEMLGVTQRFVYVQASKHCIKKSEAFLRSSKSGRLDGVRGMNGRFKKGFVPHNKGKRFPTTGRMALTQFKKGHLPKNTLYDGAESVRFNKKEGKNRVWVRVAKGKWIEKSKLIWMELYGDLPEGSILAFKDGNTLNVVPENLELITREELMRRNTIQRYPPHLKEVIRANSKLKKTISKYGKEQTE